MLGLLRTPVSARCYRASTFLLEWLCFCQANKFIHSSTVTSITVCTIRYGYTTDASEYQLLRSIEYLIVEAAQTTWYEMLSFLSWCTCKITVLFLRIKRFIDRSVGAYFFWPILYWPRFLLYFSLLTSCTFVLGYKVRNRYALSLSLIHIWRCRRIERCRSRWSPYH